MKMEIMPHNWAWIISQPQCSKEHHPWIVIVQILFHHCSTLFPETPQQRWQDECKFVSRKEMHQLNLQYNQLCDDYEALKRELYATQEENKHLKEQLKQSKFGFDSIKDTNAKIIIF